MSAEPAPSDPYWNNKWNDNNGQLEYARPIVELSRQVIDDTECQICFDPLYIVIEDKHPSEIMRLNCHHRFHRECLVNLWCRNNLETCLCPTCNQQFNCNTMLKDLSGEVAARITVLDAPPMAAAAAAAPELEIPLTEKLLLAAIKTNEEATNANNACRPSGEIFRTIHFSLLPETMRLLRTVADTQTSVPLAADQRILSYISLSDIVAEVLGHENLLIQYLGGQPILGMEVSGLHQMNRLQFPDENPMVLQSLVESRKSAVEAQRIISQMLEEAQQQDITQSVGSRNRSIDSKLSEEYKLRDSINRKVQELKQLRNNRPSQMNNAAAAANNDELRPPQKMMVSQSGRIIPPQKMMVSQSGRIIPEPVPLSSRFRGSQIPVEPPRRGSRDSQGVPPPAAAAIPRRDSRDNQGVPPPAAAAIPRPMDFAPIARLITDDPEIRSIVDQLTYFINAHTSRAGILDYSEALASVRREMERNVRRDQDPVPLLRVGGNGISSDYILQLIQHYVRNFLTFREEYSVLQQARQRIPQDKQIIYRNYEPQTTMAALQVILVDDLLGERYERAVQADRTIQTGPIMLHADPNTNVKRFLGSLHLPATNSLSNFFSRMYGIMLTNYGGFMPVDAPMGRQAVVRRGAQQRPTSLTDYFQLLLALFTRIQFLINLYQMNGGKRKSGRARKSRRARKSGRARKSRRATRKQHKV